MCFSLRVFKNVFYTLRKLTVVNLFQDTNYSVVFGFGYSFFSLLARLINLFGTFRVGFFFTHDCLLSKLSLNPARLMRWGAGVALPFNALVYRKCP